MAVTIWTVGHGAGDFTDLERRLEPLGIQTLVDVRSEPYSRHAPDFTKAALEEHCRDAGWSYRWMGATLGGRTPVDPAERAGGLTELAGVARSSPTAVLCAELDPAMCHRATDLAAALEDEGFEVVHVLGDGSTVRHQPPLPW